MALLSFTGSPHGGKQRHLPEWQSQPRITPTTIIDHSIVGSAEGAWQMFKNQSVLESHFIVDLNGEIWQLMDTDRQADANLDANDFAVSIETADNGHPDIFEWTGPQLDSLEWLHEAIVAVHPTIPRRKCTTWNGGGLGYHTLFGAPSHWTPVSKTCPGRVRKIQWAATLLPAFLNPKEIDMPLNADDKNWIEGRLDVHTEQLANLIRTLIGQVPDDGVQGSLSTLAHGRREDGRESLDTIAGDTKALVEQLIPPAPIPEP